MLAKSVPRTGTWNDLRKTDKLPYTVTINDLLLNRTTVLLMMETKDYTFDYQILSVCEKEGILTEDLLPK